jgi:hypothetical protein
MEMFRNYDTSHSERKYKMPGGFTYPRGTTDVISTTVTEVPLFGQKPVAMDVSQ